MDRMNKESAVAMADSQTQAHCEAAANDPHRFLLADEAVLPTLQERMARIVRTIEADIIPRLVRSHREVVEPVVLPAVVPEITPAEVGRFTAAVLEPGETAASEMIASLRAQGVSIESLYVDLLSPTARELGRMWDDDSVMFSDVTVAVGRLGRLMRQLSPAFGNEVQAPADGRRALLLAAPGEQHTFGLTMVAEFFRRAGWDVVCELDGRAVDPVSMVRNEWFDVVGLSAGGTARVDWLKSGIAAIRHASRNRGLGVMVGGPIFIADPSCAEDVGADAMTTDGRQAPQVAERLLNDRARRV